MSHIRYILRLLLTFGALDHALKLICHPFADVTLPYQLLDIEEVFVLKDVLLGQLIDSFAQVVEN